MAATAAIRTKTLTVRGLTEFFLNRAEVENRTIGALRQIFFDEAIQSAEALDRRIAQGENIGPLGGLPVVVKENCDVAGAVCSAGLSFRNDHTPHTDSKIVDRLRASGAVILGLSVSDPGAFSTRTLEVNHPLDSTLTVGGSSGGSGAALRAGMCLGAIGTDTGGSVRIPAACCGVVGLKPTYGNLPMDGIFPLVHSLDHAGPMACSVKDVQLLWSGLTGQANKPARRSYTIGYDPAWLGEADLDVKGPFSRFLSECENRGCRSRPISLPKLDDISNVHGTLFLDEALRWHMSHYGAHRKDYPHIARDWFDLAEQADPSTVEKALATRQKMTEAIDALLSEVDFIATPTLLRSSFQKADETVPIAGKILETTMAMVRTTVSVRPCCSDAP